MSDVEQGTTAIECLMSSLPIMLVGTVNLEDRVELATCLDKGVTLLRSNSTARSFQVGATLGVIRDKHYYRELGFTSFDAFCKDRKLAKTTVHRDIEVARRFDHSEHGDLGITRLRLFANREDALELIEKGLPNPDGSREPVRSIKSRDLQARLQALPVKRNPVLAHAVDVLLGKLTPKPALEDSPSPQAENAILLADAPASLADVLSIQTVDPIPPANVPSTQTVDPLPPADVPSTQTVNPVLLAASPISLFDAQSLLVDGLGPQANAPAARAQTPKPALRSPAPMPFDIDDPVWRDAMREFSR